MANFQLILSDSQHWEAFLPLTFTRPVAELRCGILTFRERWQRLLNTEAVSFLTEDYLQHKYPKKSSEEALFIVPNFIPNEDLLKKIKDLKVGEGLVYRNEIIVARVENSEFPLEKLQKRTEITEEVLFFNKLPELFLKNTQAIDFDFELLTKGKTSQPISKTNGILGNPEHIFLEEGAVVEYATLNSSKGKIYIGRDAEVMEGCNLRGAIALGEHSIFNMGAKIYGATTIGPYSKIGGEVNNLIVFGYTNKAHDGFLGNSVVGEWCNIGADTNSSNLKNTYTNINLWSYKRKHFEDSGLQFCGLLMGDHSKTAINTQLNTGTTVGVFANIFKEGFLPKYVDNFSWGGVMGEERFLLEEAYKLAERVMLRRNKTLSNEDKEILKYIYEKY
ncbi:MAG: GlmU family protein [Capnocytophaga sp.]|nr:GlmU family protein [Capnocytophaga sp.]